MENEIDMEWKLWAYIDGIAAPEERKSIELLLADHKAWRDKYAELLETHELLLQNQPEQPSMRLTRNVMEAIAREQVAPAASRYINKYIIRGIAAFFIALMACVVIYAFGQVSGGGSQDSTTVGGVDISKLNLAFTNNYVNIFLMANIVLALFLLDRYLSSRRDQRIRSV
jgi:anti-sigma factor RsiW